MGDFRNKYPVDRFERKKNLARKYLGEKYPALKKKISLMVYSAEKKSYNVIRRGKKFYLQRFGQKQFLHQPNHPYLPPPTPPKSQMLDL